MSGSRACRGIVLLLVVPLLVSCIIGGDPVSEIDLPVPGELIVVRDTDDDRGELYLINADGTDVRRIMDDQGYGMPVWSPDGRKIAAVADSSSGHPIVIIDVESNTAETVDVPVGSYEGISWHPDGTSITFVGIDHGREPVVPTPETAGGLPQPGILYPQVYVADIDGSPARRLTDDDWSGFGSPVWSPDGESVAFVGAENQLWAMDADGSSLRQLSSDLNSVFFPTWSPDGSALAFVGYPDEYPGVYVVDADGNDQRRVVPEDFYGWSPAWSPDGSEIAFGHYDGRSYELYVTSLETGDLRELASTDGSITASWSPDGEWIAYVTQFMRGESLGPTRLSIVSAHDPDPDPETIVRDLAFSWIPEWRPSPD